MMTSCNDVVDDVMMQKMITEKSSVHYIHIHVTSSCTTVLACGSVQGFPSSIFRVQFFVHTCTSKKRRGSYPPPPTYYYNDIMYPVVHLEVPLYMCFTAGLFYNGTTGQLSCFNTTEEFIECADPTGCGTGPAALAWDYQVCTYIMHESMSCQS